MAFVPRHRPKTQRPIRGQSIPSHPVPDGSPHALPRQCREMHHCHWSRVTDEAKARNPRQGQVEDAGGGVAAGG